jgi:hypothetical protein
MFHKHLIPEQLIVPFFLLAEYSRTTWSIPRWPRWLGSWWDRGSSEFYVTPSSFATFVLWATVQFRPLSSRADTPVEDVTMFESLQGRMSWPQIGRFAMIQRMFGVFRCQVPGRCAPGGLLERTSDHANVHDQVLSLESPRADQNLALLRSGWRVSQVSSGLAARTGSITRRGM